MQVIDVNVQDGHGLISVAVPDIMTQTRLRDYFKWADDLSVEADLLREQRSEMLSALQGMLALDIDDHQRGNGDEDVCAEVRAAQLAIDRALGA